MQERRLSEIAHHLKQPTGITSSDFTMINHVATKVGIHYDLWQQGFLYLLYGKRDDGKYACSIGSAFLSSCRQIGKTFTVGTSLFILCAGKPKTLVLWTAHHTRTSDQTFNDMCDIAINSKLNKYVANIRRANGQQEIRFTNGSSIMFGARENGFGRGLHAADVEVFDEAQILTVKAVDNLTPITNTSPNPLIVFMGNPPKPGDQAEFFTEKRAEALQGNENMLYVELAADKDADIDDRAAWAQANPSYPKRTPEAAIMRLRSTLTEDSFRREALGIWSENRVYLAIDQTQWLNTITSGKPDGAQASIGIDMPPDRSVISIACCWKTDNQAHIQLLEYRPVTAQGTQWVGQWVADRWSKLSSVVIDSQSPAMSLVPDLTSLHIKPMITGTRDIARACGKFTDLLASGTLTHRSDDDQPQLAQAVHNATKRPIGNAGAFAWNRGASDVDISPLVACTLALHGAYNSKRHPGRKQVMWGV